MNFSNFMDLAQEYAIKFSRDPRTKVGCILVSDDRLRIISKDCNNFARGIDDSIEARWAAKYKYVVHAEIDAITDAARRGVATQDAICIQTLFPCANCCLALIQVGISSLVTREPNLGDLKWGQEWCLAQSMLKEAGVDIIFLP
jgi:dCMP deaminase